MSWLARLINVFRAGKVADDIDRELAFHLAERADELTAAGASPEAARLEARRRLGNYTMQHENVRERDLLVWLESFFADIRYGLRALVKQPIFAITTILTLAIGIGANTTVFTLLHGLLLRSLPATAPQELVRINLNRDNGPVGGWLDYGMLKRIDELDRTFADISAWRNHQVPVEDADGTLRHVEVALVTGNAFDLLGLRPRLGRLITTSDDVAGGPPEAWPVVLSDRYWRERFEADESALGKTIRISGQPVTVIGITPGSFHGVWPGVEPAMYLPLHYMSVISRKDIISPPDSRVGVSGLGRLKPGLSVSDARAELTVHEGRLIEEFEADLPPELRRRLRLQVESGQTGVPTMFREEYSGPLFLMQGLVGVVLLLCCVNVSGLMLSKLHERQHEFAVRTAIGAGSLRLVRQYLTESSLIALAGAALGAAAAWYSIPLMLPFFRNPMQGEGMRVEPDQTVFLVTALSAIVTTLFFGAFPAWRAARGNPAGVMKSRSAVQRPTAGRGFVAVQVALSLVLVVIAALLSQSLLRLQNEHTGFALDQVTIQTAPFHLLGRQGDERLDLYSRMVERIGRSSSIQSVAVTWYTPMTGYQSNGRFEAFDGAATPRTSTLAFNHVSPGYFRTMTTKILDGREFEPRERRRDVCVLNEGAARALFPGQSALDQYVRSTDNAGLDVARGGSGGLLHSSPVVCRVVGIAEDAKFGNLRDAPPKTIYFPLTPDLRDGNLVFLLNARTKADAISAYRDALREIAPTVPLVRFVTLREQMEAALGSQRAITFLSTFFGIVALLLSALGLYGMLSSNVSQRTAEIGIRSALGASRASILRMILSEALRLAVIGAILGIGGLFVTIRFIDKMLYGVTLFDWPTLVGVGVTLAVVMLLASFWPARRAASVDPLIAIRTD
jgi:putative ABC transport system permease protein